MTELELKLRLDAAAETALRARLRAGLPWPRGEETELRLISVYFDTAERSLGAAGIALRVRDNGHSRVQTVKCDGQISGGVSRVTEVACAVSSAQPEIDAIPDENLRKRVRTAVGAGTLKPVAETDFMRTACILRPDDTTAVELAIDVGEIRAAGRTAPLREAEIELLRGRPAALAAVARELFVPGDIRLSHRSKAARAQMLAETGSIDPAPAPRKTRSVTLAAAQPVDDAAQAVLRECLAQIAGNIDAIAASDDPEGPHQLRNGLRRLRTAFAIFAVVLDGPTARALDARARAIGDLAGQARDLQVARHEGVTPAGAGLPDDPGFGILAGALHAREVAALARLRQTLDTAETRAFLFDLACFTEFKGWLTGDAPTGPAAEPLRDLAARVLERRWRRTRKLADGLATMRDTDRHALRKSVRKLRNATALLAQVFDSKRTAAFATRLRDMQDALGALNDTAVLTAILTGPDAPAAGNAAAERARGWVLGYRAAQAEALLARLPRLWRRLGAARPFWH